MPSFENTKEKILTYFWRHRRLPSYGEIRNFMKYKSRNSAFKVVRKMKKLGLITQEMLNRAIPKKISTPIPVLGVIEAGPGWSSPAEEELIDPMTLDEYLMPHKEATYLLKVSGDSMMEAGIMPGDLALVERGRDPKDGDIVIAEVDGSSTMKYYQKRGGRVVLVPANKKYKPIVPQEELRIAAIVKAVIRKY